jgi:hypothetical protein
LNTSDGFKIVARRSTDLGASFSPMYGVVNISYPVSNPAPELNRRSGRIVLLFGVADAARGQTDREPQHARKATSSQAEDMTARLYVFVTSSTDTWE